MDHVDTYTSPTQHHAKLLDMPEVCSFEADAVPFPATFIPRGNVVGLCVFKGDATAAGCLPAGVSKPRVDQEAVLLVLDPPRVYEVPLSQLPRIVMRLTAVLDSCVILCAPSAYS